MAAAPLDLIAFESLLGDDERDIRSLARRVADDLVRPYVAGWYAEGRVPGRELAREFGKPGLLGLHLTGSGGAGEITLDEVRLPASARLPSAAGLRAPLSCLTEARFGIIWGSMGAARDCLETALAYATTRKQFGRPIGGFQLTQAKLADMAVELQKGILLALHLGRRKDAVGLRPEQVSLGKLNNVGKALEICRTARTILGANGISLEFPVIRH